LKYCQDVGNKQGVIDAKINLANLWAQKKEYRKGIKAYLKLLEENELSESDSSLVYYNLATNSFELKKYKDSERYINVAISLSERLKDCVQLIDLYLIKAQVLMELDRYEEALVFLKKSLHESLQINDVENTVVLYKNLAKCESLLKHENKSINWYEKMIQLSDSIQESKQENYSLFKQISLENKVLSQKTENKKHLETISIQKKHKRLLITTIVLVVLLLVALSYLFIVNKKNNFKRLELIKQKIQTEEAQLENARILKDIETRQIQEDLKVKKRELILLLLHSKKRKSKLNQIIKEFDRLIGKSIVKNSDLEQLKEFVIQQSNELDVNLDIQNRLLNSQDDFFVQLLKDYPNLSKTEIKVLAFMRVGLSTKEIAETQYVSLDAVRKTRYRIRKKLCLEKNESLEKFVLQY
jgi:DNA-binding NarL/FixJ family response regulator